MLTRLLLLLCLVHAGCCWVLEVNKNPVTLKTTRSVTINCHYGKDDDSTSTMDETYRILITKYDEKNEWKIVAEMVKDMPVKTSLTDAKASGFIDQPAKSYLQIHFDVATDETIGQFVCEVDGVDKSRDIQVAKTKPIFVTEKVTSYADILKFLVVLKKEESDARTELIKKVDKFQKLMDANNNVNGVIKNISSFMNKIKIDLNDLQITGNDNKHINSQTSKAIFKTVVGIKNGIVPLATGQKQMFELVDFLYRSQLTTPAPVTKTALESKVEYLGAKVDSLSIQQNELYDMVKSLYDSQRPTTTPTTTTPETTTTTPDTTTTTPDTTTTTPEPTTPTTTTTTPETTTTTSKPTTPETTTPSTPPPPVAWPSGNFTLLSPEDDCPNQDGWRFGSLRFSTQPGRNNNDTKSPVLSLSGDVLQRSRSRSYVSFEMCSKVDSPNAYQWPSGSYCFMLYSLKGSNSDSECPAGFHYGYARYARYEDGAEDIVDNLPSVKTATNETLVSYCCRDDGSASHPMQLPSTHSFFLYRFGGECQQVLGMKVTSQWVQVDTKKGGSSYSSKYHPDGTKDGLTKFELCYYTPK